MLGVFSEPPMTSCRKAQTIRDALLLENDIRNDLSDIRTGIKTINVPLLSL